jgi:DNA modification methylase
VNKKKDKVKMRNTIICNDAINGLKQIPDGVIQTIITSPPYWGLRRYDGEQAVIWDENNDCQHDFINYTVQHDNLRFRGENSNVGNDINKKIHQGSNVPTHSCAKCGAWKGSLGLEPDFQMYITHLVQVFREARRVLRDDGTLWLNMGDCYWGSGMAGQGDHYYKHKNMNARNSEYVPEHNPNKGKHAVMKNKDLVGMPWRVALALQEDGWWLRNDLIWQKIDPMPESPKDRFSRNHEYIFLLAKSAQYYFDIDATREPLKPSSVKRMNYGWHSKLCENHAMSGIKNAKKIDTCYPGGRNKRTVWTYNTNSCDWEYCQACDTMFIGKERTALKKRYDEDDNRILICPCGEEDAWVSHFAAFSSDLIEPCILAGAPPKTCAECFTPYKRKIKVSYKTDLREDGCPQRGNYPRSEGQKHVARYKERTRRVVEDLGFHKQCACETTLNVPAIVLDLFMGSGTTAIASAHNSRDYIGIDISQIYCTIAEARIRKETQQLLLRFGT